MLGVVVNELPHFRGADQDDAKAATILNEGFEEGIDHILRVIQVMDFIDHDNRDSGHAQPVRRKVAGFGAGHFRRKFGVAG